MTSLRNSVGLNKYTLVICLLLGNKHFICGNKVLAFGDDRIPNFKLDLLKDMSTTCVDDLKMEIYLTLHMGVSDSSVIIVSDNEFYPNCIITYYLPTCVKTKKRACPRAELYILVVVEFPDHTEGQLNACQDEDSTVKLRNSKGDEINVCYEVNKMSFGHYETPVYRTVIKNSRYVSVIVKSKSLFETLKITVTAATKLEPYQMCNSSSEIPCLLGFSVACISKELMCDQNINCGAPGGSDEDVRSCDEAKYKRLWMVVIVGLLMLTVIGFFLINVLRTCLPLVPDSFFIFNEDEDNKLMLATKFVAPPEHLSETARNQMPLAQSSSFKFKTVPLPRIQSASAPPLTPVPKSNEKIRQTSFTDIDDKNKKASLRSSDAEIEVDSVIYMNDLEETNENLDSIVVPDEETPDPTKLTFKRPRFEDAGFVTLMDKIDSLPEVSPPENSQQKKKQTQRQDPTSAKSNIPKGAMRSTTEGELSQQKSNRATTFTFYEKQQRRRSS